MQGKQPRVELWLRITPETPLLLGNQSGVGNFQVSADFIPGSSIRGAVAQKLLNRSEADFEALFGDGEPYFGNAYLGGSGPVWPFPLTARTCKQYGGLSSGTASDDKKHHGVIDMLAADFAYDLISDPEFPYRSQLQENNPAWHPHDLPGDRRRLDKCSVAIEHELRGASMVPATGYYALGGEAPGQPLKTEPPIVTRTTHVGINRARGVAQDQLLFTQERLAVHEIAQWFFARVTVPTDKVDQLQEALSGVHYVGRGRSRGNGRVIIETQPDIVYPSLSDRLFDFQQAITQGLLPYQRADARVQSSLSGTFFSVTLRSSAIFHDAGKPLRTPTAAMLGLSQKERITCIRAWARMEQVGGWDSAARLPRRKALAARAGSVYLFWARGDVEPETLEAELAAAELNGVGGERERGYGQFTVCASFHYFRET